MRELKFRAWRENKMHFNIEKAHYEHNAMSGGGGDLWDFAEWLKWSKVMQYTGLKDKNGVEIYEGDFIRFEKQEGVWPDQIRTHEVQFPFICGNAHLGEVIGNIFENSELLEK